MKRYQAVLILDPDLDEKALADFKENFNKLLKDGNAENIEVLEDNIRDMSYSIKKHPRTYFWRLAFESETSLIDHIKQEIRHDERLLRQTYLIFPKTEGAEEALVEESKED